LPPPPLVKIGVWEDGAFIGCVLFSRGANNNIGKAFGLTQIQIAELTRVALTSHKTAVSRILRIAFKMLSQSAPGLRLVVSYADPSQGHIGGIYQASGFIFLGQSPDSTEFLAPDGKQWHGRMISSSGRTRVYGQMRSVWRSDQCSPVTCPGKLKYVCPLDDAMRQQIAPLAKPYPKRATSIGSDVPGFQSGEGGATPTVALHSPIPRLVARDGTTE
jgi:hypothetical protein